MEFSFLADANLDVRIVLNPKGHDGGKLIAGLSQHLKSNLRQIRRRDLRFNSWALRRRAAAEATCDPARIAFISGSCFQIAPAPPPTSVTINNARKLCPHAFVRTLVLSPVFLFRFVVSFQLTLTFEPARAKRFIQNARNTSRGSSRRAGKIASIIIFDLHGYGATCGLRCHRGLKSARKTVL